MVDLLARKKIWMLLDAHQDQWHETDGGEGVPDWAVIRPAPYNAGPRETAPFPMGYWLPELSTVFDNFSADHDGLLDGWVDARRIAARQGHDPTTAVPLPADPQIAAPTRIFVSPLHYPHGCRVVGEHGRLVSRAHHHLSVRATSDAVVTVRVVRRNR
ncbi:MAG: endoglycoceramidase [Nocardioides sp.]|nr:endoglycoceramidase [Nocardioides sp.]